MADPRQVLAVDASGRIAHSSRVYMQNVPELSGAFNTALVANGAITSGQMAAIAPITSGQMESTYVNSLSGIIEDAVAKALSDGFSRGAFGDLLVAQPYTQVYAMFPYAIESGVCRVSGVGALTYGATSGMGYITTEASTTGRMILETQEFLRYIPAQGGQVKVTPRFQSGVGSQKQLVGCGNDSDGFFVGMSGATGGIWYRHHGSEDFIPQTSWSENTAPWIDWTKGNVFQIQFKWLGFGQIKFSMEDPNTGGFLDLHYINYSNRNDVPSVRNPSFPLRAEINNNGSATERTIRVACLDGRTEGYDGLVHSFACSGEGATSGAVAHLLTLRNNTTFYGVQNSRLVCLKHYGIYMDGNNAAFIELHKNLNMAAQTFLPISTHESVCSYATNGAPPSVTSGALHMTLAPRNALNHHDIPNHSITLGPGETVSILARRVAGTNVVVYSTLQWEEHY